MLKLHWLLPLCFAASLAFGADRGQQILLWPGGPPGFEGISKDEVSQPVNDAKYAKLGLPGNFTEVHRPSVYAFLPPAGKANGTAMLVIPGGGHNQVVIEKEGYDIAEWLNERGVAAFVLKYRLSYVRGAPLQRTAYNVEDHALADTSRGMRLIRSRAAEWGVEPDKIGVIGFSAGGELAALIETRFKKGDPQAQDPIERVSSRPDFAVVVYPGYRRGTINARDDSPPSFLVCASDDRSHVYTTVDLYLSLLDHDVPVEMHLYTTGGHGFALRPFDGPVDSWEDRLWDWLVSRRLVRP